LSSANAREEANKMAIRDFGEIAEKLRRSTVLVLAGERGNGSGVIWSADGVIVTNAHVARASRMRIQLWDGREFDGALVSRDTRRDLAELRISATNLPAAIAADSAQVRPGELAIAIGNPLGFVGALTTGVIHTVGPLNGPLRGPLAGSLRGFASQPWVQADVRLAPGNSGGPLADASGRVIGINTMVAGNLALAVPSNAVTHFLAIDPIDAWLGVSVAPVRVPRPGSRAKSFGLVLLEVEPGSPAANASLLAGDILLGTEEKSFSSLEDLSTSLQGKGPRLLRLAFLRGNYERFRRVTVQLGGQRIPRSTAAA
jgi:serine protease Do